MSKVLQRSLEAKLAALKGNEKSGVSCILSFKSKTDKQFLFCAHNILPILIF